jgi:hypothetical protein
MGVDLLERATTGAVYEVADDFEILPRQEFMHADAIIDRQAIELHAVELIANLSQNKNYLKNTDFYNNDARTALFEALRASGHLSVVESKHTSVDDLHKTMLGVLVSGWSDQLPEFEKRRRFQEICEELTTQEFERRIVDGDLPADTQIATLSDYVMGASEKQALSLGYRPYNKKGMVRSSKLIIHKDNSCTRVTEQVSRSNADAHETELFLEANNIPTRNEQTADVRVLGTQLIYSEQDFADGVVGIMRRLDYHKGKAIRYGEPENENQSTYVDLRDESKRRELEAECYVGKLADYTKKIDQQLSEGKINKQQHKELLQKQILNTLRAICTMRPDYAKDCFGDEAYKTFEMAASMAASGDTEGASGYIERNSHLEKTVTLCGMSISEKEAKEKGIQPDSLNPLLKYGMEKFKTRIGRCRVPECPSPKPTEVGPCDVCMGSCQPRFDKGISYNKIVRTYRVAKKAAKKAVKSTVRFFSFKKSTKHEKMAV